MGNCLCSNEMSRQLCIKNDLYIPNDDEILNEAKRVITKGDNFRNKTFTRIKSNKNSNRCNSTLGHSSAISTEIFMHSKSKKSGLCSADLSEVANSLRRKTIDRKIIPKLDELSEIDSLDEAKDVNMLDINSKDNRSVQHTHCNNFSANNEQNNETMSNESKGNNDINNKNTICKSSSQQFNCKDNIINENNNQFRVKTNANKSSHNRTNIQSEIIETESNRNNIETKSDVFIPSSTFELPKVSPNPSQLSNDEINSSLNHKIHFSKTKLEELNISGNKFSKEEEKQLLVIFFSHFMFRNFDSNLIKTLVRLLRSLQIQKGSHLFNQGEQADAFYIIKSGTIRLTEEDTHSTKTIKKGQTFGEIALIPSITKRKYNAIAETDVCIYYLSKQDFLIVLDDKLPQLFPESFDGLIKSIFFFNMISDVEKREMIELGFVESFPKAQTRISWNCNSVNKKAIFISKGKIKITNKINNSLTDTYSSGNCFFLNNLFFQSNVQINCHIVTAVENTELIFLYEKMLIEVFGINYQKYLAMKCIYGIIEKDLFLSKFKKHCKLSDSTLFSFFTLKNYHKNETIIPKGLDSTKQVYILINGSIVSAKNNQNVYAKPFTFFKSELLVSSIEFDDDLIASRDMWVLKTDLNTIKNALTKSNSKDSYLNIIYNLKNKFPIFTNLELEKIIKIASHIKIKTFEKGKLILEQNKQSNHFYLIVEGTIKITSGKQNTKIRIIEEGNTFDEMALLNESPLYYNYIAKTDLVVLYQITQEYFIKLLEEGDVNEYIRRKALMESYSISLNDLYYLSYLGRGRFGNVCLVHNEIDLYAIKAISKQFAEKQKFGVKYLLFEKQTLCSIDHPFILKMVKTLKNENWIFFLMEYIRGINLNEYLDSRKIKKNIYETKFYAACLFLAIQYLHQKKIVHRDIKPSNIMIDKTGYLKVIDFGTAKKLKSSEKTNTVIGTPNFIAPEVLGGKGYSFSADFWSIGICLFYIFYGSLPFGNNSIEIIETYKEILYKDVEFPDKNNNEINSLISALLEKNDKKRNCDFKNLKTHVLFCDFNWEDLIQYKIKPPFTPAKDPRHNEENLQNKNMPFVYFMDNERCDTKQTVTLKCSKKNLNMKEANSNNSEKKLPNAQCKIPDNWFEHF